MPLKNNLARDRIGYAFEINDMIVGDGIATSAAVWGASVTISADDALAGGETQKSGMSAAVEFLVQVLREGPVDQAEIVRLGEDAGFTAKNLRTAREKLGIQPKKEVFGAAGKWVWPPPSHLRLVVDNESDDRIAPASVDPLEIGANGRAGAGAAGDADGGAGAGAAGNNAARAGAAGDGAVGDGAADADGGRGDQSNGLAGGEEAPPDDETC